MGASGVVLSLVAANAALFPHIAVRMYGLEISALGFLVLYLGIDLVSHRAEDGQIDASSHAGGALCGWLLAQHWKMNLWV